MGVACAGAGNCAFQSSLPVSVSKARMYGSNAVPATNTTFPAVTMGPPSVISPGGKTGFMEPSGTCHLIVPRTMSTAVSVPQGGGMHGMDFGENIGRRNIAYGAPIWDPY